MVALSTYQIKQLGYNIMKLALDDTLKYYTSVVVTV